jgi:hypothetical protein
VDIANDNVVAIALRRATTRTLDCDSVAIAFTHCRRFGTRV